MAAVDTGTVGFTLNGSPVRVPPGSSLLDALREHLGIRSAKDGCSPQGQCGCCTVWVDGQPRVACVTPVGRVAGRAVTTIEGLDGAERWAESFCANGGSQCGFCTSGIIMRVAALDRPHRSHGAPGAARPSLPLHRLAPHRHLRSVCLRSRSGASGADRSGGEGIVGGWGGAGRGGARRARARRVRRRHRSARRAGRTARRRWRMGGGRIAGRGAPSQRQDPGTAHDGAAGMADRGATRRLDAHAADHLGGTGVPRAGRRVVRAGGHAGELARQRRSVRWEGDDRGRRCRPPPRRPARTSRARPVHPRRRRAARPEAPPDRGRCARRRNRHHPGRANSGDRRGDRIGRARFGGRGGRRRRTADHARRSAAGWAEAAVLLASISDRATETGVDTVTAPNGATASAAIDAEGAVHLRVGCGDPLDEAVLRSYCTGAAHMALGWVRSEGLAVAEDGTPLDLTIRSFGVLRAVDTPPIHIEIEPADGAPPTNGSDAVCRGRRRRRLASRRLPARVALNAMNRDPVPSAR